MSKGKNNRKGRRAAEQAERKPEQTRIQDAVVVAVDHATHSATAKHERDTEEKSAMGSGKIKEHISVSNVLLVIFTGVLAAVAVFQIVITNNQLGVMRNDERAWMEIKPAPPIDADSSNLQVVAGDTLMYPVTVANIGKTPARNLVMTVFSEFLPNEQSANLGCVEMGCHSTNRIEVGIFFPNLSPVYQLGPLGKITPQRAADWAAGTAYIVLYGIVTYDDVFNVHHWTKFCFWNAPKTGKLVKAADCTQYNNVDNN